VERGGEEVELPPCTSGDYAAFFAELAAGAVGMDEARVRLMPAEQFEDGNPAANAGVEDGARILTVNGKPVKSFREIHEQIGKTPSGDPVRLTWSLAGEKNPEVEIVRRKMLTWNSGIALAPVTEPVKITGVVASCREGSRRAILNARRILQTLGGLVTGRISPKALGGPIKIFQFSYVAAERNVIHFFYFLGILSINLAILNILPIPLLDGGHLFFILIEAIKGKPLSERTMAGFQWAGLLFLLLLLVFVMTNDISSFF
jgi:regulator of sigma E protease